LGFDAHGRVYVYDDATRTGTVQSAGQTVTLRIQPYQQAYDIVVPVGPSGVALLGDTGKFASLGRQRISALSDDGRAVRATVRFAAGEGPVTLSGYAAAPSATASYGSVRATRYNARTHMFGISVTPGPNGATATVSITRIAGR